MIKLETYPHSIWRGVSKSMKNYKKGDEIIWWSFSSCTNDPSVLESSLFLGKTGERTLFKIDGHNGKKITNFSSIPSESEVLLIPGTTLKVNGILDVGNGLTIIDLIYDSMAPQMIDFTLVTPKRNIFDIIILMNWI